ncbi:MAG: TolC family protein [Bacteroidetes bacterium]|nr:TolC family protein [Bacteroidota bacterium]
MRSWITNIFVVLFLTLSVGSAIGQNNQVDKTQYFNPLTDDITKRLPPLRVLVDSASHNSPTVKYEELKAEYYYYEQISAAREWLEYFTLNLDAVGGRWGYDDWSRSAPNNDVIYSNYSNLTSWRSAFASMFYVRMPIGPVIDRRNRINKQKKWIEISLTQSEINKRYLQERVILIYNEMVSAQSEIRIYNDYQQFTMMQMQMAQNEFLNGEISTAEYTRLKEIQTTGAVLYLKAISAFNKNYQTLEVITGMRFNLITVLR